jgi:ribonuclease HII
MTKKLTPERRKALKAELMASLEEQVDAYLDWYDNTEDLKFREVEKQVLETRKGMGTRLAETIVAEEATTMETGMRCPICGGKLRRKGRKEKVVVSLAGEVKVERDYYYCPNCQRGFFPPGPNNGDDGGME